MNPPSMHLIHRVNWRICPIHSFIDVNLPLIPYLLLLSVHGLFHPRCLFAPGRLLKLPGGILLAQTAWVFGHVTDLEPISHSFFELASHPLFIIKQLWLPFLEIFFQRFSKHSQHITFLCFGCWLRISCTRDSWSEWLLRRCYRVLLLPEILKQIIQIQFWRLRLSIKSCNW